jgi:hypothetical protein
VLGRADLSATSRQWRLTVSIPKDTEPGNYALLAQLAGINLAATKITIATTSLPHLNVIDPATNQIIPSPQFFGGAHFDVRGEDFPDGEIVIGLNGAKVATTRASDGKFVLSLKVPGSANSDSQSITVRASGSDVLASVSFETLSNPK